MWGKIKKSYATMKYTNIIIAGLLMTSSSINALNIVTIEHDCLHVLRAKAQAIKFPLSPIDKHLIAASSRATRRKTCGF